MTTDDATTLALADSRSCGAAAFAGAIVATGSVWVNRRLEPTVAA